VLSMGIATGRQQFGAADESRVRGERFRWREAVREAACAVEGEPSNGRGVLARLGRLFDESWPMRRLCEQLDATQGRVGLFGYTWLAKQLVSEFEDREILYIIDNDPAKQGQQYNGVEVVSFEHAQAYPPEVVAIASTDSLAEIEDQLRGCGAFEQTRILSAAGERSMSLSGCRAVEWSWVVTKLPAGPGCALDFGCAQSNLGLVAARLGFEVTAIDLKPVAWLYDHARLTFVQGDLFDLRLAPASFDVVINCSTVEHVGLAGRYTSAGRPDGDLEAMQRLLALTKPGGTMLLTVPVGEDRVIAPLHRVYGAGRLARLLDGWQVKEKEFWAKNETNRWLVCSEDAALSVEPTRTVYALGCFVLRRP